MKKAYLIYAGILGLLFVYANYTGWKLIDSLTSGSWNPNGRNYYHK